MRTVLAGLLSGLIAGIGSFIIGSALWFAPWAAKITNNAKDLPIWKNLPIPLFLPITFVWGLLFSAIMGIAYAFVFETLPKPPIVGGIIFGIVVWLLKNLPEAVNSILLIKKPISYVLLELFNALIGLVIGGILIALLFTAFTKVKA